MTKPILMENITLKGEHYVIVPKDQFELVIAGSDAPPFPGPNTRGNVPALETMRVSIAVSIIAQRKIRGLSRSDLSKLAKVSLKTLEQIETAVLHPTGVVSRRIDNAFSEFDEARRVENLK